MGFDSVRPLLFFCGDCGFAVQRGEQGVPGEDGAFDAHGEFMHATQGAQAAHRLFVFASVAGGEHPLELGETTPRLGYGFAFELLGHQRSRGLGNCAARALKTHIADDVIVQFEKDGEVVAAERIVAFGLEVGFRERAEIARIPVVIQNHILVNIVQVVAHDGDAFQFLGFLLLIIISFQKPAIIFSPLMVEDAVH